MKLGKIPRAAESKADSKELMERRVKEEHCELGLIVVHLITCLVKK